MANALPLYFEAGPLAFQRFGWHCFTWAWRRGSHRPVARLSFGWHLSFGVWLGRDEDGDLRLDVALLLVRYDLVLTTWGPSPQLVQWAAAKSEEN